MNEYEPCWEEDCEGSINYRHVQAEFVTQWNWGRPEELVSHHEVEETCTFGHNRRFITK